MQNQKQHAILLACFDGVKTAANARARLETALEASGDTILDTVVFQTDTKNKSAVYDPRRVMSGTLIAAVTWGLFGLATGSAGIQSLLLWAVIGAVCGGLFAYFSERILSKDELARLGKQLPAQSSAFLTFTETSDAQRVLDTSTTVSPSVASVAIINNDLTAYELPPRVDIVQVSSSSSASSLQTEPTTLLSMILVRYPAVETAKQIAARLTEPGAKAANTTRVELVIETDQNGKRHVEDPTHGVVAWSKSNLTSWGGFGLVFGAIAGAFGGGGVFGLLQGGLITGILWGLFGLGAGVLYGKWAGTAVTSGRLKSIGPLLPAGTSMLVAWAEGAVSQNALAALAATDSQRLVLGFNRVEHGAVLEPS